MPPFRRSQRLSTQPHGRQNDHAGEDNRKRSRPDGTADGETGYGEKGLEIPKAKRFRLTKKNLREHRKQERAMTKTRKTPSDTSGTTSKRSKSTTTTTDLQFGRRLAANGVVFAGIETIAPSDRQEIEAALAKSLELPAEAFDECRALFRACNLTVVNELTLESDIIRLMLDLYKPPNLDYRKRRNEQWTEVDNEITAGLSDPKPDVSEAYPLDLCPAGIEEDFEELVPTQYGILMPTFAMESKGQGDACQAEKQAAYDGANMTYASIKAEIEMGKSEDDLYLKTKAITITLTPTEISVYANHAVKDGSSGRVTYHQYCVERIRYFESKENWGKACNMVVNAQAFAFGLANSRIRDLEEYFKQKDERLKTVKAAQEKLQAEARAKSEAAMSASASASASPGRKKRQSNANPKKKPPPSNLVRTAVPAVVSTAPEFLNYPTSKEVQADIQQVPAAIN